MHAAASSTVHARQFGHFFDRRLAAQFVEQLLAGSAQLGHRLDHVHRDADRAGLVRDGAGDGLTNPPGGVRRELVAAAIFVLVDRPHQAGVPFLDQVEEATCRGCGTSWRSRRPAAGCRPTGPSSPCRRLRSGPSFPRSAASATAGVSSVIFIRSLQFLLQVRPLVLGRLELLELLDLRRQVVHPAADLLEPLHDRLQTLRPHRHFFDEQRDLPPTLLQSLLRGGLLGLRRVLVGDLREVGPVLLEQVLRPSSGCAACGPGSGPSPCLPSATP